MIQDEARHSSCFSVSFAATRQRGDQLDALQNRINQELTASAWLLKPNVTGGLVQSQLSAPETLTTKSALSNFQARTKTAAMSRR
jgi:hypothetical protein